MENSLSRKNVSVSIPERHLKKKLDWAVLKGQHLIKQDETEIMNCFKSHTHIYTHLFLGDLLTVGFQLRKQLKTKNVS